MAFQTIQKVSLPFFATPPLLPLCLLCCENTLFNLCFLLHVPFHANQARDGTLVGGREARRVEVSLVRRAFHLFFF